MKKVNIVAIILTCALLLTIFSSCNSGTNQEKETTSIQPVETTSMADNGETTITYENVEQLLDNAYSKGNAEYNDRIARAIEIVKAKITSTYESIVNNLEAENAGRNENPELQLQFSHEEFEKRFLNPFKEYYEDQMKALAKGEDALINMTSYMMIGASAGSTAGVLNVFNQYHSFCEFLIGIDSDIDILRIY